MKLPHETFAGTITAGFVLTIILVVAVKMLAST